VFIITQNHVIFAILTRTYAQSMVKNKKKRDNF